MADKAIKRKPKRAKDDAEPRERKAKKAAKSEADKKSALRSRTDPRTERRFLPEASIVARVSIYAAWAGALLVGAGLYGQWLRPEALGPHKAAPYLLFGGAAVLLAVAIFGQRDPQAVRVGDAGVGVEKDAGTIERIAWCDVSQIVVSRDALTLQATGRTIAIPMVTQAQAVARALAEARQRIPKRAVDLDNVELEPMDRQAGEVLPLEPPQVAGHRCKATDKLIAFERDARLCGRCGELYHKDGVPDRCETCNAPLAAGA